MFYVRYVLLAFLVLLLDDTVAARLAVGPVRPDLGLALVVFAGLGGGGRAGVLFGLLIGLARGTAEPELLGIHPLLLSLVGFAAGSTSPMINRRHPIMQGGLIAMLLLAHDLLMLWLAGKRSPVEGLVTWITVSPAAALYTALIVPFAAAVLPRLLFGGGRRAVS